MNLVFRAATRADLPFIIERIVADTVTDVVDLPHEPDHPRYLAALAEIDADPNQLLVIAELQGKRVGTMQLTFIPGLSRLGARRCLIEAVFISPEYRGQGLGSEMIGWALERARDAGCGMVQLTSNKKRLDAHRFYERLGFHKSHEGFKYYF